ASRHRVCLRIEALIRLQVVNFFFFTFCESVAGDCISCFITHQKSFKWMGTLSYLERRNKPAGEEEEKEGEEKNTAKYLKKQKEKHFSMNIFKQYNCHNNNNNQRTITTTTTTTTTTNITTTIAFI
ncbi:Hypothetical predicted protein, partial [Octopus vulgaris]